MFGLYSKRDVEKLVARLREEYSSVLKEQQRAAEALKEENRTLSARLSELEAERANVAEALIGASREGDRLREEQKSAAENAGRELALLTQKCRLLSQTLAAKYSDAEDVRAFSAFVETLRSAAGEEDEEPSIDMDEVLAPKQPLDLGKLCKDLGLMEEN